MSRPSFMLLLVVTLIAFAPALAAPEPKVLPDPRKDCDGNPLPKGATARLGTRPFHGKGFSDLAFSADGKKLMTTQDPEQVLVWDTDTGKSLPSLPIKWGDESNEESSTGSTIVGNRTIWITHPRDKAAPGQINQKEVSTAYAFDLANGSEVARIKFEGRVYLDALPHQTFQAAVSADGKYLAVASGGVEVFDMEAGKRLHRKLLVEFGGNVHISPDSKTLYVWEYKKALRRFELLSGKELPAIADTVPDHDIHLFAASPDGKRLGTLVHLEWKDEKGKTNSESVLTMHDTVANKTLGKLEIGADAVDFGFAGSDAVIVLASKYRQSFPATYTLSRWNTTTLKREWEVPGPYLPQRFLLRLIVSPDGNRFAFTDQRTFAHVYDAATGKVVVERSGHDTVVSWVGFSPDGEKITTIGWDGVRTWSPTGERKSVDSVPELTRGRIHPTLLGERLVWVTLAQDGKSSQLVGWDQAKGEIGWRMPVDGDSPERILTHDGKQCVGFSWNEAKRLWDVAVYDGPAGKKLHSWTYDRVQKGKGAGPWWWPMAVSPDGNTLFVGNDGIVGLDVSTGKEKLRLKVGQFETDDGPAALPMAVSGNGKTIAVIRRERQGDHSGNYLRVFDSKTGKELGAHELDTMYKPALRFSPNGKQVAVWNVWGVTVHVCDSESSENPPRKLVGDKARVSCAAFSPNGASLVVGYEDGTALVWDLTAK
jgi:WD40 repeat protein